MNVATLGNKFKTEKVL